MKYLIIMIIVIRGHYSGYVIFSLQLFVLIENFAFQNQSTLLIRPTTPNNCKETSDTFLPLFSFSFYFLSFLLKEKEEWKKEEKIRQTTKKKKKRKKRNIRKKLKNTNEWMLGKRFRITYHPRFTDNGIFCNDWMKRRYTL